MEGTALCKALKGLGEGLLRPSAEPQDVRSCACLCCFPASPAQSSCSPLHPRLLFTDYGSLWSRRQVVPTLGEPCPGRGTTMGAKPLLFHPRALLRVPSSRHTVQPQ